VNSPRINKDLRVFLGKDLTCSCERRGRTLKWPYRLVKSLRQATVLLFLAATPVAALDPDRAITQYVVTKWGAGSLPGSGGGVLSLAQSGDDYLWLGTAVGLARFDGARFDSFDPRHTHGLADGGVSRLATAPDGSLYVGTTNGITLLYKDGGFSRVAAPAGAGDVRSLLAATDGTLWIGVHGRSVHRVKGKRSSSTYGELGPEVPHAIIEDAQGHVWIGTWRDGIVEWDGHEFKRHRILPDTVQALHLDHDGTFWIGTPHGLYRWRHDGSALQRFTTRDGLSHDSVTAILEDGDRNLWIGTRGGGLNRRRDGRFTSLGTREGLSDDDVRCLLEDREGNLWVGTADGLNALSNGRFVTYGAFEGLPDPTVPSVAPASGGGVWIGSSSATISRLRGGVLTHVRLPEGIGREAVLAMHEDRRGRLWMSIENGRIFCLEGTHLTEHTPRGMDATTKASVISEDDEGPLFYASHFGLSRLQGGKLVPLHRNAPRFPYVHSIYRDAAGKLWLGTSRGLARVDGPEDYVVYRTPDGLPHERVRSLSGEPDGGLWAATIGGLAYVKDGRIRALTLEHGLPDSYLRLVLDDGLGHLWLASTGRVFRLDKAQIHDVFAGRASQVTPVVFDVSDGLRTTEALLGNSPGARSTDGRLWFATARGVSVVDPARLDTDEPAPPVRLESVSVDRLAARQDVYPPGRGEVSIEYAAFRFRAPGKVRFRYRMEGFDDDWVHAGTRRNAYYSNLPPGHYVFSVNATNRDGKWNGPTATFAFELRPPFHQRASFYLLCAAVIAAAGIGIHRFRVGQVHERFSAIVSERTRIARELHDTLAQGLAGVGLQIDTALDRIPEDAGLGRARQHMQRARRMVRSSLAEVRRSIWVLRAQTSRDKDGFSQSLAESLAHLTADTAVQAKLDIQGTPRTLSAEVERNLLRIAHEAVTNTVRHAQARALQVKLQFDAEAVSLGVHDDGRGFDPAAALAAAEGEHFGLTGIVERVRALGGDARIVSRPGVGTDVLCRLPYDCRMETAEVETIEGITL